METAYDVQPWQAEAELWEFLADDSQPPLDLARAAACGLW